MYEFPAIEGAFAEVSGTITIENSVLPETCEQCIEEGHVFCKPDQITGSCYDAPGVFELEASEDYSGYCYSNVVARTQDHQGDCTAEGPPEVVEVIVSLEDKVDEAEEEDEEVAPVADVEPIAVEEAEGGSAATIGIVVALVGVLAIVFLIYYFFFRNRDKTMGGLNQTDEPANE